MFPRLPRVAAPINGNENTRTSSITSASANSLLPPSPHRKLRRVLLVLENFSLLYRNILPLPFWLRWYQSNEGGNVFIGVRQETVTDIHLQDSLTFHYSPIGGVACAGGDRSISV